LPDYLPSANVSALSAAAAAVGTTSIGCRGRFRCSAGFYAAYEDAARDPALNRAVKGRITWINLSLGTQFAPRS